VADSRIVIAVYENRSLAMKYFVFESKEDIERILPAFRFYPYEVKAMGTCIERDAIGFTVDYEVSGYIVVHYGDDKWSHYIDRETVLFAIQTEAYHYDTSEFDELLDRMDKAHRDTHRDAFWVSPRIEGE
jgi:hypothetical protein